MTRRNRFKVDAESVQGNAGAWAEFKAIKLREWREWLEDPETSDPDLLKDYLVAWGGIVDENDVELPSPKDEPGIISELYTFEIAALGALLLRGPIDQKN